MQEDMTPRYPVASHGGSQPVLAEPLDYSTYDPYKFLTPIKALFVKEYLVDFNGTAAAKRVGYKDSAARTQASTLLNDVNVAIAIQQDVARRAMRIELTQDMVIRELGYLALSNIDYFEIDEEGFVSVKEDAPGEAMRAVKGFKRRVRYVPSRDPDSPPERIVETEIILHDKISALRLLGTHLGMFIERREVSGPNGGPIQVQQKWIVGGREIIFQ